MSSDQPTVLAPASAEYVLPTPPRGAGEVVVVAPRRDADAAFRRGGDVARALGERFALLAEHQQVLAAELRERLLALDAAIADAARARLKGEVREVLEVLDWSEAAQQDLVHEAQLAAQGMEPLDVVDLCEEVAARVASEERPVYVRGRANASWWGNASALAGLLRQALALVDERTHGVGARSVVVDEQGGSLRLAIRSAGEPGDAVEACTVARFRQACARVGATVQPDALGVGGAGFVLELPRPPVA